MKADQIPEALLTLYLRLNGYFTTGLVVHSSQRGQNRAEIDCLAIRHPFHDQMERGVESHSFLSTSDQLADLLLCEVKTSLAGLRFNDALRNDVEVVRTALRWSGLLPPTDVVRAADALLPLLQDRVTTQEGRSGVVIAAVRVRALLCCPSSSTEPKVDRWFLNGTELLGYVHRCLNPRTPRPSCSPRYSYELWGDQLEPLVRYFKELAADAEPTFHDVVRRVGAA